jgi:hypothetical protein
MFVFYLGLYYEFVQNRNNRVLHNVRVRKILLVCGYCFDCYIKANLNRKLNTLTLYGYQSLMIEDIYYIIVSIKIFMNVHKHTHTHARTHGRTQIELL